MPNAPPYSVEIYWRTHIYIYIYNTYNILSSPSNKRKTFDIRQFWGKDLSKRIVFQDPYWVFVDFCCSPAVSPMFQPMVALAKSTQAPTSKKDPCVTKCGVVIGCKYRRHYGNIYIYIYIHRVWITRQWLPTHLQKSESRSRCLKHFETT